MCPGRILLASCWLRRLRCCWILKQPFIRLRLAARWLVSAGGLAVCVLRAEIPVLQRCTRPAGRRILAEQIHPARYAVGGIWGPAVSRKLSSVVGSSAVVAIRGSEAHEICFLCDLCCCYSCLLLYMSDRFARTVGDGFSRACSRRCIRCSGVLRAEGRISCVLSTQPSAPSPDPARRPSASKVS